MRHVCDRVLAPLHPYSRALLAAAPATDPARARDRPESLLPGELPSTLSLPPGCVFHTRCPIVQDCCRQEVPALRAVATRIAVACHYA